MTDLQGSSVILYSDKKFIHHQYYVATEWTGGLFVSPTLAGSRYVLHYHHQGELDVGGNCLPVCCYLIILIFDQTT